MITYHRVLKHLLVKRTVENYGKFTNRKYVIQDILEGAPGWCDFANDEEWGECTEVYQNPKEAENILKTVFSLDIQTIEKVLNVHIDPKSYPKPATIELRSYIVQTLGIIHQVTKKKLESKYTYENFYTNKGVLLVGIFDPAFGGFDRDLELNKVALKELADELKEPFLSSSFRKVVLVDGMAPFYEHAERYTYTLLEEK